MGPISPDSMFSNSSRERYFDKKDNGNYQNGRPSEMEPLTELPSNDDLASNGVENWLETSSKYHSCEYVDMDWMMLSWSALKYFIVHFNHALKIFKNTQTFLLQCDWMLKSYYILIFYEYKILCILKRIYDIYKRNIYFICKLITKIGLILLGYLNLSWKWKYSCFEYILLLNYNT